MKICQWKSDNGIRHGFATRMANGRLEVPRCPSFKRLRSETYSSIVNNDIRGLLNSVNDGSTSAFMWEWFTTKPFVDAGEGRFVSIGSSSQFFDQSDPCPDWFCPDAMAILVNCGSSRPRTNRRYQDLPLWSHRVRHQVRQREQQSWSQCGIYRGEVRLSERGH